MRILIVGNLYPPVVFGGYEILCAQVVEGLRRRGHQVEIACSRHAAETAPAQPDVHRILELTTDFPRPGENVGRVDFRPASLSRVSRLNRDRLGPVVQAFRPDLIFSWCLNRLGLASLSSGQKWGVPVAYTINDEHPRQFGSGRWGWRRWLQPESSLAALPVFPVTVISYALRSRLLAQNLPLWHARVIHQGIPLEAFPFQPLQRSPEEPLRLLYVGQLSHNKGVHSLLQAAAGEPWQVTVVGDGVADYEAQLQDLARQARVDFLGRVPHARVGELLRSHHVLVFPSIWEEPFGLSHLEAMASGCAVVSTTTGGSAELIRHQSNALAFRAGDVEDLQIQLRRLDESETLRQNLLQAGRLWVERHHSLDVYVERLERFLNHCLSQ